MVIVGLDSGVVVTIAVGLYCRVKVVTSTAVQVGVPKGGMIAMVAVGTGVCNIESKVAIRIPI